MGAARAKQRSLAEGTLKVVHIVLAVIYPFAVHVGVRTGHAKLTASLLGGALVSAMLARLSLSSEGKGWAITGVAALTAAMAALSGHSAVLMVAPVVTNLGLMLAFGATLFSEQTLVERLARMTDPDLTREKVRYCRSVTMVWTAFFVINASVIAGLAMWAPLAWWTVYCGVIAYVLAGALGVTELSFRVHLFGRESAGALLRLLTRGDRV